MGIKNLWTILTPFCDRKPLYEMQGKTVAVDLSCWICEAQNIAEYQVQPRMYLRNLYFRTCFLLLMDVCPVFVLEGKAPELKYDTIAARNAIQFKGAKPKADGAQTGKGSKGRSRFDFVLKQCEEMLRYLGLACIKGNGEAESLCAYLNEDGLVDGCISQDSDCFAYGAQVVYRNFSISTQGRNNTSGGSVDIYDIRKANQSLKFGRNKIVAMALLIGCDYSDGIYGIGKDAVMKYFETVSDEEVLDKLRSWRNDSFTFTNYEKQLNDKNICTSCGHSGKIHSHTKNGCLSCKTTKGCDPFKYKNERLKMKNELNLRNKAIQDPNFPDETLIKEFLIRKDNVTQLDLKWRQPNLVQFVTFATKFLQWEQLYSFEKILPILTRWQCQNASSLKNKPNLKGIVHPLRIKKVRNPKGVPSYEIIWSDPDAYFKDLIPEKQLNSVDPEKLWSTIEPQHLVQQSYPELIEQFQQSKIKPKKPSKRKKKDKVDDLESQLQNVSISEPVVKKTRKPRATKKKPAQTIGDDLESSFEKLSINKPKAKTIDSFFKRAIINAQKQNSISTPAKINPEEMPFDPDMSGFGDEEDLELSDIVSDIVSRKKLIYIDQIVEKYTSASVTTEEAEKNIYVLESDDEDIKNDEIYKENYVNSSSFFMSDPMEENDLFERTFNMNCQLESSGEETEEYEFDEEQIKVRDEDSSDEDNFCDIKYNMRE